MQCDKRLSQCYKKTQSCHSQDFSHFEKRDLSRQLEAEHPRLLKLLQPFAFHINPGLYDTTHNMVNASAQA